MTLTLTDLFCGAGGSSTGAVQVPGIEITLAVNHWERAIETHAANHPDTEHLCADIQVTNPHYLPSTDILWASPSCTNHSRAKGKKRPTNQPDLFGDTIADEAAEKSRATMWNVPEFSEAHGYNIVLIENVVEAMFWLPFKSWLQSMDDLGYNHQLIFLNSMHASWQGIGAPQSRDRMYVCFWKKGNPKPDLEEMQRPEAWCGSCNEIVRSRQWWKNPNKPWGKYKVQYLYRCPNSACRNSVVEPIAEAAATIIDWTDLGERIGDREKPLAEKTMLRIQRGIERHWSPIHLEHGGNGYDAADPKHPQYMNPDSYYRAWPVAEPFKTMHTRESKGIALHPLMVPVEGRDGKVASSAAAAMRTQTTRNETAVGFPPFLTQFRDRVRDLDPAVSPLPTVVADGANHALVSPPLTMAYYGSGVNINRADDPLSTITTVERHALITRMNGTNSNPGYLTTPAGEPVRTITTAGHQAVLQAEQPTIDIDDVYFRMLNPTEIKQSMAFAKEYQMVGTRREQVKMSGNAVCPPASRDLVQTVAFFARRNSMIARCERCGVPAEDVFCVDCREVDPDMWQDAVAARRQRLNTINLAWLERRLEAGWLLKELAEQLRVSEHALGRWHRLRCTREHRRSRDERKTA